MDRRHSRREGRVENGRAGRRDDGPEARARLLLDYASPPPTARTGGNPPARLPNAVLVVHGAVHHRQLAPAARAEQERSDDHPAPTHALRVSQISRKQVRVAQVTERAGATANSVAVHRGEVTAQRLLHRPDHRRQQRPTRELENGGPLAVVAFFEESREGLHQVLFAPLRTETPVMTIESWDHPHSLHPHRKQRAARAHLVIPPKPLWMKLPPHPHFTLVQRWRRVARGGREKAIHGRVDHHAIFVLLLLVLCVTRVSRLHLEGDAQRAAIALHDGRFVDVIVGEEGGERLFGFEKHLE